MNPDKRKEFWKEYKYFDWHARYHPDYWHIGFDFCVMNWSGIHISGKLSILCFTVGFGFRTKKARKDDD